MAICRNCGAEYDPASAREEYLEDDDIISNNLEDYFGEYRNCCAQCRISFAMTDLNQGLEDLSYHIGDD